MKKFITATALLAAGAAFSNATDILSVDFTQAGSQTGDWTSQSRNSQPATDNDTGLWANNWGQDHVSTTLSNGINLATDGEYEISYSFSNTNNDFALILVLETTDFSLAVGNSYNDNAGLYLSESTTPAFSTFNNNGSNYKTFQNGNLEKDLTLKDSVWGAGDWTIVLNLTSKATGQDVITFSLLQGSTEVSLTNATYSFESDKNLDTIGFVMDSASNNLCVRNLSVSIAAIPEPSAFGLLAGIGALALAATRRRRK